MVTTKPKLKAPPASMEVPPDIQLKRSGVDPERIGIWCKAPIPMGKKFGPFLGNRVQEATDDMDPSFVWEIVDLETKEFLFYIDATEESDGTSNWMRYINCARYYEEQNIVSEQEGVDIFYRAIKDIYPGEEILTWYERAPLRKRKGRKARKVITHTNDVAPSKSRAPGVARSTSLDSLSPAAGPSHGTEDEAGTSQEPTGRQAGNKGGMHVSQRGRRRKVTKYWEMESEQEEDTDGEVLANKPPASTVTSNKQAPGNKAASTDGDALEDAQENDDEDWKAPAEVNAPPRPEGIKEPEEYYQFEMKSWHSVKSRMGRKVFKCDICSSVYRHSFSLKRHYIRNHINYNYVSPTDLINCSVPVKGITHKVPSDPLAKDTGRSDLDKDVTSPEGSVRKDSVVEEPVVEDMNESDLDKDNVVDEGESDSHSVDEQGDLDKDSLNDEAKDADVAEGATKDSDPMDHSTTNKAEKPSLLGRLNSLHEDSSTEDYSNYSDSESEDVKTGKEKDSIANENSKPSSIANSSTGQLEEDEDKESVSGVSDQSDDTIVDEIPQDKKDESVNDVDDKVNGDSILSKDEDTATSDILEKLDNPKVDEDSASVQSVVSNAKTDSSKSNRNKSSKVHDPNELPQNSKGQVMYGLYRCNVCEKIYDTMTLLKEHIANHPDISDGRKPFACEKCDMKFAQKQNLMRHQAVHTGSKAYICSHCDKRFPSSANLRRHEKLHQGRKFSCPHCTHSFTQTGELKKHVRKVHPEVFHECGFCTRYFLKQRALQEHLQESHENKTLEENEKEIEARKEAFDFDLQMDKAESRRLAVAYGRNKLGPRYACTVCRKRFVDYPNMCRHRRLAHQRPIFVPPIRDENGEIVDDGISPCISAYSRKVFDVDDDGEDVFYSSVANRISENLQNFIEGREEQLKRSCNHIKWKGANLSQSSGSTTESSPSKTKYISPITNPQEYNFPQGFKFREPHSVFRKVQYSIDGTLSLKNKKQPPAVPTKTEDNPVTEDKKDEQSNGSALMKFLQNDMTNVPHCLTSTSILANAELQPSENGKTPSQPAQQPEVPNAKPVAPKTLPIRIPQVKRCHICRCLFHNNIVYQSHMLQKHKVVVPEETDNDDHSAPIDSSTSEPCPQNNGHKPSLLEMQLKSEPIWDLSAKNDQAWSSVSAQPEAVIPAYIPIQDEPLDLSKKSHFAGYSLSQSDCVDNSPVQVTKEVTHETKSAVDVEIKPQLKAEVKKEPVQQHKYICTACFNKFEDLPKILEHQKTAHPDVECRFTQLADDVIANWQVKPNPLGMLNVCATSLPPMTDSPKRTQKPTCTKCNKSFSTMRELHTHIADCAEPYRPKMTFVFYYPGKKNRHFFLPGNKGSMVKVEKGKTFNRQSSDSPRKQKKSASTIQSQISETKDVASEDTVTSLVKPPKESIDFNPFEEEDQLINGRKRRRRNYELLYNPHKHIRRREMAEIIDTQKCSGCGDQFGTISLLERHIPMCTHKNKIIDQHVQKPVEEVSEEEEDVDEFDPKKHTCIYCLKQFIYFGMLRKHVFDVCGIRRDLVEKGEYIDEEWEKDINTRAGFTTQTSTQHTLSRQSSVSSLTGLDHYELNNENSSDSKSTALRGRRRRRRGNGWYKGKGNLYKKKDTTSTGWEPYFVLDETFMGMYNGVNGDDEDDDDNASALSGDFDDASNDSVFNGLSREGSQDSRTDKSDNHMQMESNALFEELKKPINKTGVTVTQSDESKPLPLKPEVKHTTKRTKKTIDANNVDKISKKEKVHKKKVVNKEELKTSDKLTHVKQKLAKKIMENKNQQSRARIIKHPKNSAKKQTAKAKDKNVSKRSTSSFKTTKVKVRATKSVKTVHESTKKVAANPKLKLLSKKLLKVSKLNKSKNPIMLSITTAKPTTKTVQKPAKNARNKEVTAVDKQKTLDSYDETIESVLRNINNDIDDDEDNVCLSKLKDSMRNEDLNSSTNHISPNSSKTKTCKAKSVTPKKMKGLSLATNDASPKKKAKKDQSIAPSLDGIIGASNQVIKARTPVDHGRSRGRGRVRGGRGRGLGRGKLDLHSRSYSSPISLGYGIGSHFKSLKRGLSRSSSPMKRGTFKQSRPKKRRKSLDLEETGPSVFDQTLFEAASAVEKQIEQSQSNEIDKTVSVTLPVIVAQETLEENTTYSDNTKDVLHSCS